MPRGRGIKGQEQGQATGVPRRLRKVDKPLGARAWSDRFWWEGKLRDMANVAIPVKVQSQLKTEDGRLWASGLDADRRDDSQRICASQEKADDLVWPEGTASPVLVINQTDLGETEGHSPGAVIHDLDQERKEIVSESPGTMVPGPCLDRHV